MILVIVTCLLMKARCQNDETVVDDSEIHVLSTQGSNQGYDFINTTNSAPRRPRFDFIYKGCEL